MIVVPVDEELSAAAGRLEELLLALDELDDPIGPGLADLAADLAAVSDPEGGRYAQPVVGDTETVPLAFLPGTGRQAGELVELLGIIAAGQAPQDVTDVVDDVADWSLPGRWSSADPRRWLRDEIGRLAAVVDLDHGSDPGRLDALRFPGGRVQLTGEAAVAYRHTVARILTAWRPGDPLTAFAWLGTTTGASGAGERDRGAPS